MRKALLLVLSFTILVNLKTLACSPYGTPIVTNTVVGNNLNISVTSTSGWACCYHYQLELICNEANFTGVANYGFGTSNANSPTLCKPNASNIAYPVYSIDISQLCPGVTYKFQLREKHTGYAYWSNWSAINTFTITGPAYSVDVAANQTLLCPPDCAELTATAANACGAVNYTWNPAVGTGANQTVCPTVTTTYSVTGTMIVPFCPIAITSSASVSIGIQPVAVAGEAALSPQQICSGQNTTLTLTGHTGNIEWQSSASPGGPFVDIPGATTAVYATGPITQNTFFRAYVSTCTDEYSNVINVQVFDIPTAAFTSADVCLGQTMNFTDQSIDNISVTGWNWSFGDGSNSIQQNPSHLYSAPGNYTVTLEAINLNNCPNTTSTTVTVFPIPAASFTFNTVCEDQLSEMLSTSVVAGPSTITGYAWDINENGVVDYTTDNITHNFNGFGNYNVSLTVTADGGCVNTFSDVIPVFPLPNVQFTATPLCLGEETTFTDQTTVPAGGSPVSWQWIFGDGNGDNLQNTTHTYANPNTYSVELIVESDNGCFASAVQDVDIFALPVAGINVNNECFYDPLNFQNGSSGNATAFQWSFGDGNASNLENPAHQYVSAGIYQVALIVYTLEGCTDTIVQNVTAYAQPQANFSVDPSCVNSGNQFTDNSTINTVDGDQITGYSWSFGDGNTSAVASPSHTYDNEGVYNVNFLVTSNYGCINVFNSTATVWPLPESNFSLVDVCLGESVEFSDLSQVSNINTANSINSWNWNFGEGGTSNQQNPIYTYNAAGTYNATLTVTTTNGCSDLTTLPVTVFPIPAASFTFNTVCEDQLSEMLSTSVVAGPSTITGYAWDINENGVVDYTTDNITHNFNGFGNYNVSLTVTADGGCVNTFSDVIPVFPLPNVQFTATPLCLGEETTFTDQTTVPAGGSPVSWQWIFGDGNGDNLQNTTHTYANPNTYSVELIVESDNGCFASAVQDVDIFALPVAGINVNNECFYDPLNFQNGSSGNATAFQWSFGDGNASNLENPAHQYVSAGIYQVALIVYTLEGCTDTIVQNVTAYAQPQANFSVDPSCVNSGNQFTDNSTINTVDGDQITGYSWSFGDGNTSAVASPSHTYDNEGVYNVNFLVTSNYGCINVFNSTATVWPLPESNFSLVDVCLGESVEFSDLSQVSNINTANSINSWNWNFGEGGTSNQQNPIYTYNAAGTYNATLTVTTTNGCSDLTTLPVTVHPTPVVSFIGQSLDGCSPICPSFTSTSTVDGPSTISNYNWILSNGMNQNSSDSEYIECLENSSSETITLGLTLIVTSDQGCTASYTEPNYINIYHYPIAEFYYTPNNLTSLNPEVEFINTSSYSNFYSWTFGNIGSSFETNPGFVFPDIGQETYEVTLIASTSLGCTDTAFAEVFIEGIIIFYVPNTFTPDQDVYNEVFSPIFTSGFDPFDYHLTIFNRWGEIVFESFDHTQGWNGTYGVGSNRIAEEGTYTWKIEFKELMSDKRHQHHGHVYLLK